ncbi:MAG TPA: FG-GAP-like repeat-containing protein, partial [Pyrinomonadaceae bacterium]|nr:FG-GAP-like repeat-containing protein [Pyrinomonadaceae bacterium]
MKSFCSYLFYLLISTVFVSALFLTGGSLAHRQTQTAQASREDAYRANNIGVALLEQFKHKEAAESFKNALKIDPKLNLARVNLSIALFNVPDLAAAHREAQNAAALAPEIPQPHYILGLIAKVQSKPDEALAAFQRVLKIDPNDVGANINVGQLYSQQRKYPEAIAAFRLALAAEPYNATALYNLGQALMRSGQREEGQKATARFTELRQRGSATTIGQNYLEQGRYAEAIASTGAEPDLVDRTVPAVTFSDATAVMLPGSSDPARGSISDSASSLFGRQFNTSNWNEPLRRDVAAVLGGNITLFDMDADGNLDLFRVTPTGQYLFRGAAGKFIDVTQQSGGLASKFTGTPIGAVAGDYDNDNKPDLFVIRDGSLSLYHNDGAGKFSDVTGTAAIPAYPFLPSSVAFVDVDHDGDLDLFVTGLADLSQAPKAAGVFPGDFAGAPNLLLRNDGNGKFTDVTTTAKLNSVGHSVALIPTDFNNRRDMDLLVVSYGKALELYSNQRDGTFSNVSKDVGLDIAGNWSAATAGDVNKDGFTDFVLGRADGPALFVTSDGKEKFKTTPLPSGSEAARAIQLFDYDNDGLLDCVMITEKGLRVWRNVGNGWMDTSERAVAANMVGAAAFGRAFGAGDIDNDGDTDILLPSNSGVFQIARNDGGNTNHSLRVKLTGKVSNRSSVGTKIEVRAGSLLQKVETSSASPATAPANVLFGLGKRTTADAVRVIWPAGIVQAETEIGRAANTTTAKATLVTLDVTELDRKPSSCPYLYAWNGERFEFITDFMGGGEMGHLEEPGRFNKPDPDEYVRIRGDQLKERNGRYELRVTNELEEAVFADQFQLIAVDHLQGVGVYPNEGLTDPPRPFKLYATRGAQPPLTAVDDHGNDVLSRITRMDRQYPDNFRRDRI